MSKSKKKTQRRPKAPSVTSATSPMVNASRPATIVSTAGREFAPDYTYVKQDLRRIGLLAGTLIAALIILSFVLR